MEERGNKTIMCSVLFLDIVEYSRKPVADQIALKDRFNNYLSIAIRDVPMADRIILDTGDGAAINFLGDVEDALKAALSLRESLLSEDENVAHPLMVRMGINLGPVRLVRDINGQPNIVGDGINVAQRVMGFADVAQILVSRSYYDAVSRLSPQYAGMFHYQGSRTDKHVREHEVYAIGYPGDKTTLRSSFRPEDQRGSGEGSLGRALAGIHSGWQTAVAHYHSVQPWQRFTYIGSAVIALLLVVLIASRTHHEKLPAEAKDMQQANAQVTAASVEPPADTTAKENAVASRPAEAAKSETRDTESHKSGSARKKRLAEPKIASQEKKVTRHKEQPAAASRHAGTKAEEAATKASSGGGAASNEARIAVICKPGTEVFVDGVRKGSVSGSMLSIEVSPGSHTVIASHSSGGIYSQTVNVNAGTTAQIQPNFCK